ncbi:MAG: VanZ family protein [Sandaracinaceae bacterium]|jgi:VanZ family protein|nr:VanZ family protein [Sandaracinaceae bacterium]
MTLRQGFFAWAPAVLYMALIWTLSSFSAVSVPIDEMPFQDKGAHFVEYGMLGILLAHACIQTWKSKRGPRTWLMAVIMTTAWGALDEVHQAFVPARNSDIFDLAADCLGACIGALVCHGLYRFWISRRQARDHGAPKESP